MSNACMKGSQFGYILNSDMTVTSSKQSGKTPIGVVVCSYSGNTGGQAMALDSIGSYKWGGYGTDISTLPNYTSRSTAVQDIASCENSKKIRAQGNSSTYPAVWAAYNYTTTGTKAGDWCLPAAGIFTSYYNNQSVINTGFSRAGGTKFTNSTYAWSSSEYLNYGAWRSHFNNSYGLDWNSKRDYAYEVRPVIGFCKAGYEYDKSTDTCKACSSTYKYTCTGSNQTGGSGTACNGKYNKCTCATPYTWKSGACVCGSGYKYTCTSGANVTGGSGTACNGKYNKCTCATPYTWKSGACVCDTAYQYACVPGNLITGGSGTSCNGKYKTCSCESGYYWGLDDDCNYKCLPNSQKEFVGMCAEVTPPSGEDL